MPAIITHDTFGRELYGELCETIGQSEDEKQAFLLGCQGPDVFFYGSINPRIPHANKFGKNLHRSKSTEFISALALSVPKIKENLTHNKKYSTSAQEIAKAYALGYLMHFELDSKVHPLVYSEVFAYCTAGVLGLDASSESEVHVEIECELDELILTVKRGQTISTFDPSYETLRASERVLHIVGKMYEFAIPAAHHEIFSCDTFRLSVKAYRQTLRWLYSVTGVKRELIGRFETLFRQHSYLRAMIHKNIKLTQSIFDNHEQNRWKDPWLPNISHTESFWDLYNKAFIDGEKHICAFCKILNDLSSNSTCQLSKEEARNEIQKTFKRVFEITENKNFYGCDENIIDQATGRPKK